MYASRFSKRKAKGARRPYKRVPRKRSGGRTAITKIVKSIISRQAENKAWFDYGANNTIACVVGSAPVNRNLIPTLSQGTGHSQRVGNEVRVKSGYVRGHVNILPYDSIANNQPVPIYVKIWIVSQKVVNTNSLTATTIGSNFFDIVNGSVGMQGSILDIDFTTNKDVWTVHGTKTCKLGAGYASAGGAVTTTAYYDNSPMSVPFSFNFGKTLKTLKFDDATNVCTNRNMWIMFQCCSATGQSSGGQLMAEFHYTTRVEYEDL